MQISQISRLENGRGEEKNREGSHKVLLKLLKEALQPLRNLSHYNFLWISMKMAKIIIFEIKRYNSQLLIYYYQMGENEFEAQMHSGVQKEEGDDSKCRKDSG